MTYRDLLKRSGRNLGSSKVRTILTSLAIAVGGFTLVLTMAAGNGLREYTTRLVQSNFDPTELLVGRDKEVANTGAPITEPKEYDETVSSINIGNGSIQVKRVSQADVDEIKALPFVESVRENYQIDSRYITTSGKPKYTLSTSRYNPGQKPELRAGNLPNENQDLKKGQLLLPEDFLGVLGFADANSALGSDVSINVAKNLQTLDISSIQQLTDSSNDKTTNFKVVAVTKKSSTSFGQPLPVYIGGEDATELYNFTTEGTRDFQKYLYVNARIKDGTNDKNIEDAKAALESKGYFVQSSKEIQQTITQFVNVLQIMVGVFGLITLVAAVFGIINTQYISVLERTREIGLMKALGMSSGNVRKLFMFEAAWIGFLGGVIGSVLALIVGMLLNPWVSKKLDLGEGNSLIIFDINQIIGLIVLLSVIAMIAGLVPAIKASRMDPITALRQD